MGASLFDIPAFGARCAYTIDGSKRGELQDETFSGDEVRVRVTGVGVHPGFATGKLVSALRVAAQIVAALPSDRLTPETTSGREGFIHPTLLHGTTERAEARFIVRDFRCWRRTWRCCARPAIAWPRPTPVPRWSSR
jgi:tripeptide aminopeptidase